MNTPKDSTGGCCPPPPCSALAGTFDIEAIEQAFFNHDHEGAEPATGQWEKCRDQWRSFKAYLAAHPRQETLPERTDGGCTPIVPDDSPCLPNNKMKDTLYVSCTQKAKKSDTLIYKSMAAYGWSTETNTLKVITNNTEGLSKVYNKFINAEVAEYYNHVVFVHDDVWIDDAHIKDKLNEAMHGPSKFDIVGLAGTREPKITHPALWHLMASREHHRGYAGHIFGNKKVMTGFGATPDRVAIIDGLFVAVNVSRAIETGWRWNENFEFHHYDIASCIDANAKGMRIGVWPINVFHASPGLKSLDDMTWSNSNKKFLELYS